MILATSFLCSVLLSYSIFRYFKKMEDNPYTRTKEVRSWLDFQKFIMLFSFTLLFSLEMDVVMKFSGSTVFVNEFSELKDDRPKYLYLKECDINKVDKHSFFIRRNGRSKSLKAYLYLVSEFSSQDKIVKIFQWSLSTDLSDQQAHESTVEIEKQFDEETVKRLMSKTEYYENIIGSKYDDSYNRFIDNTPLKSLYVIRSRPFSSEVYLRFFYFILCLLFIYTLFNVLIRQRVQ